MCLYVGCMHAYACVSLFVVCLCMCVFMYVCECVCVCVCICGVAYLYACVSLFVVCLWLYVCMSLCVCIHMYLCTCVCACVCVCLCVSVYGVPMCVSMCVCLYVLVRVYACTVQVWKSKDNFRCQSRLSTLFEARSLLFSARCELASLWASLLPTGELGLQRNCLLELQDSCLGPYTGTAVSPALIFPLILFFFYVREPYVTRQKEYCFLLDLCEQNDNALPFHRQRKQLLLSAITQLGSIVSGVFLVLKSGGLMLKMPPLEHLPKYRTKHKVEDRLGSA